MPEIEQYQFIEFPTLPEPNSSYLIEDMIRALAVPYDLSGGSFSAASAALTAFNTHMKKVVCETKKVVESLCLHHAIYHMLTYDAQIVYGILWELLKPEIMVKPILAWQDGAYNTNDGEAFLLYYRTKDKPTFRLVVAPRNQSCYLVLTYISHRDCITFEDRGSWDIADPRCFDLLMEKLNGVSDTD